MSVMDDGTGLPLDYYERGYGFTGMRIAVGQMGGSLEVLGGVSKQGNCNNKRHPSSFPPREVNGLKHTSHATVLLVDDHEMMSDGLREVMERPE